MPFIVLKPFLYFVENDIIEEATEETKSADYVLFPNELKIALELGGVQFATTHTGDKLSPVR